MGSPSGKLPRSQVVPASPSANALPQSEKRDRKDMPGASMGGPDWLTPLGSERDVFLKPLSEKPRRMDWDVRRLPRSSPVSLMGFIRCVALTCKAHGQAQAQAQGEVPWRDTEWLRAAVVSITYDRCRAMARIR